MTPKERIAARHRFAAAALTGLLAGGESAAQTDGWIVDRAFHLADAMLDRLDYEAKRDKVNRRSKR